jgi:predicted nucleic acid-binding protein
MGAEVMSQIEAWEAYDLWLKDDRIRFLEEPPNVEAAFRNLARQRRPNAKNWSDAYLAAFAVVSGMSFVTFDQGFRGQVENLHILRH